MNRVAASAPGKLVLTGEYAVLEGATAVVLSIDRRAVVVLDDNDDDTFRIEAPDVGVAAAHCRLGEDGRVHWLDVDVAGTENLALVTAVLRTIAEAGVPAPFRAVLDSRAFVADGAAGPVAKLGLGSSAALAVALAGAIHGRERRVAPSARALIDAHRRFQHGRGSGVDIAASLSGGVTIFRRRHGEPQITSAAWPSGLAWCCVWTGRSASTRLMLDRMAAWRAIAPRHFASLIDELGTCAAAADDALQAGDTAMLLETVAAYAAGLARLGEASGVDIVCAEHRAVGAIAAACGVTYKSCGAGGGDIGVALATDPDAIEAFRHRLRLAGFRALDLKVEAHGLLVQGIEEIHLERP